MIEICGDEAKVEISTKFLREREFIGENVETLAISLFANHSEETS